MERKGNGQAFFCIGDLEPLVMAFIGGIMKCRNSSRYKLLLTDGCGVVYKAWGTNRDEVAQFCCHGLKNFMSSKNHFYVRVDVQTPVFIRCLFKSLWKQSEIFPELYLGVWIEVAMILELWCGVTQMVGMDLRLQHSFWSFYQISSYSAECKLFRYADDRS